MRLSFEDWFDEHSNPREMGIDVSHGPVREYQIAYKAASLAWEAALAASGTEPTSATTLFADEPLADQRWKFERTEPTLEQINAEAERVYQGFGDDAGHSRMGAFVRGATWALGYRAEAKPMRPPPCGNIEPHEPHRLIWEFDDPGPPWCPGVRAEAKP